MENTTDKFLGVASDLRVNNWPLMSDPIRVAAIASGYIAIVNYLGPWFMKNRDGFKLKSVLQSYNLIQILLCGMLVHKIINEFGTSTFDIECNNSTTDSLMAKDILWWTMCLKNLEMIETVFFVLRKKQSQVSFLHVYHHVSSFLLAWIGVKYYGARIASSYVLLNCLVHIVMYAYYAVAATGNQRVISQLAKWKKYVTLIQMIQFTIILIHVGLVFTTCRDVPLILIVMFFSNIGIIFSMFYNFYTQNYTTEKKHN